MREVAILGAGELGGALAHALARLDVARSIRLIDHQGNVAQGKALDIAQAAPIEGFATRLSGTADLSYAAGADLLLLADRFGSGEWTADEAVALLRRTVPSRGAPIICAGASSAAVVDRGVRDLAIPRARLIGSAPEALAAGARALVALALRGSPQDVALPVIGMPPAHTIVPWTEATFAGFSLTRRLDEPVRRGLEARIIALWPPGPLALAAAAAKMVACIDGRSRQIVSGFVAPDASAGACTRVAALPLRLGPGGLDAILLPALSIGEQVALDNAMRV